jgi:uncharacterized Zn finger protein
MVSISCPTIYCPKCAEKLEVVETESYPYKISYDLKCPNCGAEYEYGISLNYNGLPDGDTWLEEL